MSKCHKSKVMAIEATMAEASPVHRLAVSCRMLGALGVVYGDIGTSPLYTLKTALEWAGGATPAVALGMLSLIIWTLLITTSIKYVAVVMRADNDGEGGILALMSLLGIKHGTRIGVITIGLLGAALLYGDGAITPAISVLSALEGLKMPVPAIAPYIVMLSALVLVGLFALQTQGSERIGKLFGPIISPWFITIGLLGLSGIDELSRGAPVRLRSTLRLQLSAGTWLHGFPHPGSRLPVRDRRRGALCRHGSFRTAADPVRAGTALCSPPSRSTTRG